MIWKQYIGDQAPAGPEGTRNMYDQLALTFKYLLLPLFYLFLNLYKCSLGVFPMSSSQKGIKLRSSSQMDLQMM